MPEGPLGSPRITNLGPFSRNTEEELQNNWSECPLSGKENKICQSIKFHSIQILQDQNVFPECKTLIEINEGKCGVVAKQVANDIDGVTILQVGDHDHLWIEYNSKHYDAEVPTGVDDIMSLPIFGRIPSHQMLEDAKIIAEMENEEIPQTIEDTIHEVKPEEL